MPRLQLDLPERFLFSTEIAVYIGHINAGFHLDNAQLLSLVSEARCRFFASMGYREDDVEGLATTVADALAIYRSEAFQGEVLVFGLSPQDFNKYGFDLVWCATEKASGREVARGKTGLVFIRRQERRVAPVPPAFIERATAA